MIRDGQPVEMQNRAPDPLNHFEFQLEDLDGAEATWHTHPQTSANLSIEDYWFFTSWPLLLHFVISEEEVRCYVSRDGHVFCIAEENDLPPRLLG